MAQPRLPSGRALVVADLLVVAWVLLWVALGLAVADAVRQLTGITDGFASIAGALGDAAAAVDGIDLPLVGGGLDQAAGSLREAGRDVAVSGEAGETTIERTANVLGAAVALVPSLPLVVGYLPPRLSRTREVAALRRLIEEGADEPGLERFLAHRAAERLSYRELRAVSAHPWRDLEEGRYGELADAELRRVGLRPRAGPPPPPRAHR